MNVTIQMRSPNLFGLNIIMMNPDENFALLRKWADPQLPDPYGNSYSQEYTIADLKRLFGATYSRF